MQNFNDLPPHPMGWAWCSQFFHTHNLYNPTVVASATKIWYGDHDQLKNINGSNPSTTQAVGHPLKPHFGNILFPRKNH